MPVTTKSLHLAAGPQAVLLFHGLASSPQELQFLARGLHQSGFTVRVPTLGGYSHGAPSPHPVPHREWVSQALAEFDALRAEHEFVAVGGLCIGSVLALRVASLRSGLVAAMLGLSTTLHYDGWATPWSRRLLPLARVVPGAGRIRVREQSPFGVKEPRMRAFIERQMTQLGSSDAGAAVLTVRELVEAQRLIASARRGLGDITAPTLMIHARDDDAASPRSAFEVASGVASTRVRTVLLNDSFHMISIDQEKQRVLAEMLEFLDRERREPRSLAPVTNLVRLDRVRLRSLP